MKDCNGKHPAIVELDEEPRFASAVLFQSSLCSNCETMLRRRFERKASFSLVYIPLYILFFLLQAYLLILINTRPRKLYDFSTLLPLLFPKSITKQFFCFLGCKMIIYFSEQISYFNF
ncbi:hypothetical protein NC651_039636 [Populus alba x Populus x berolinensis]|nr:hypothetical protein NC651_039636 [Populus alba x Populus x berolinensis]